MPFGLDPVSFVSGVASAAVVGFGGWLIGWLLRQIRAPFQPQVVRHLTNRTPWQVFLEGVGAFLVLLGLAVEVAALMLMLLGEPLSSLRELLAIGIASILIGAMMRILSHS